MGVGAERWACVMHVSCAVSPCVDSGLWWLYCCAVVSSVCLLCRLWVHALAVFNIHPRHTQSEGKTHGAQPERVGLDVYFWKFFGKSNPLLERVGLDVYSQ